MINIQKLEQVTETVKTICEQTGSHLQHLEISGGGETVKLQLHLPPARDENKSTSTDAG